MTRIKSLFVFLFALALSQVHGDNLRLGARTSGDQALERLHLKSPIPGPGQRLGVLDEMRTLQGQGGASITQVEVEDRSTMGCVTVTPVNGGPGSTFVVLRFQAPEDCTMDFLITLYGKLPAQNGW